MKCPMCGKEIKGKSCSYCNFVVEEKKDEFIDEETIKVYNKKRNIFIILLVASFIISIFSALFNGILLPTAIIIFIFLFYSLFSELRFFDMFSKKKLSIYLFLILISIFFNVVPLIQSIDKEIRAQGAGEKYGQLMDIELPDRRADQYVYLSNHITGTQNDVFIFEMTDEEISKLYNDSRFEDVQDNNQIYNIFMSSVGKEYDTKNKKFLVYDKLGNRFDYIVDLSIYNYVIVVLTEENTVFVCDMFKAQPNSED